MNTKSISAENMLTSLANTKANSMKRQFNRNNSEEHNIHNIQRIPSKEDRDSSSRPRGRLNFYDSDTFSENFLINGSHPNKNFKKNGKDHLEYLCKVVVFFCNFYNLIFRYNHE